jgi:hypothetical protein
MTASAALLNTLSLEAYAREAFCLDSNSPTGFVQGGIYAGPLHAGRDAKPEYAKYSAPGDKPISARARLLSVAPGKVFVRWAGSHTLGKDWKAAASGIWWVTDNIADRIALHTAKKYGPYGDSSSVARHFGNVGYTWTGAPDEPGYAGAAGTYKSDMGAVVVCRTTMPIKVLVGVGRPVVNPIGPQMIAKTVDSGELQIVMLTTISSPNDAHRRSFIGDQFLTCMFFSSSAAFTGWWRQKGLVDRRRSAQVNALRGR